MGTEQIVSVGIDSKALEAAVMDRIKAGIVEAIAPQGNVINALVSQVLWMKVDSEGRPSTYSSATTYNEYLFRKYVMDAVKEAMKEQVAASKEAIKECIVKELATKRGQNMIAGALVDALSNTFDSYRTAINIEFKPQQ